MEMKKGNFNRSWFCVHSALMSNRVGQALKVVLEHFLRSTGNEQVITRGNGQSDTRV